MGLMQQAYDTYCAMAPQYAGIYGKAKEPLVPVSHQIVNAELELTLDADGHLLDARSAISVTERQSFIGRVRNMARVCAAAYLKQREELGYPLIKDKAMRQKLGLEDK